ncbi:MAG: ferrous iron transport protein A [Candidatus Eisenbacteria bacterium]|uniref:Ferrous iron transport protein A n=1 Tax=Eiseniibacteriota bacterium TaxID=2212470 RepID=A0A948RSC4_UNCEI|nr:ferrous iron transport protein A [Candidatus Eisenbacteria bacterium]MBU1950429.1 ferrous iron transport protein A [Candidatus Eisenbacteria bacterium]MBU2690095.1 ferrous iron transport protein A [Candidatus Eisenbacteria bacterium]
MPLTIVQAGRRVRLVSVEAGYGLQGRLTAMGLIPGAEIKVLRNSIQGPFLIEVKGGRIMLGRGMAQKIMVE